MKYTRIASTAILGYKKNIDLHDHIWIGHYCLLDGIGGITIKEGVNIASHTVIYTHGSHDSIRLLGRKFIDIPAEKRTGYKIGKVYIGEYTFIGTSCVILSGVTIGKGCIIGAGSVVTSDIPDYSVASGNPAVITGDTRKRDEKYLQDALVKEYYYNRQ